MYTYTHMYVVGRGIKFWYDFIVGVGVSWVGL